MDGKEVCLNCPHSIYIYLDDHQQFYYLWRGDAAHWCWYILGVSTKTKNKI